MESVHAPARGDKELTITDQLVGEIARLSRLCRMQEEVIARLSELAQAMSEELAQHREVDLENNILEELKEQGWISTT